MSESVVGVIFWLLFIFFSTTAGAALACVFPGGATKRAFPFVSGFSAGVMLAASVWSLLIPAIENSRFEGFAVIAETGAGFITGGIFMVLIAKFLPEGDGERVNSFGRLFTAVTVHNIPEGLAVGFAFGATGNSSLSLAAASSVALGIGIQNLPEGAAVSLPARRAFGRGKAFLFGTASGAVEPIAGAIGFLFAGAVSVLLPSLMAFAAGAMIFAAVSDVLPEALENSRLTSAVGVMTGFLIMSSLDILFG